MLQYYSIIFYIRNLQHNLEYLEIMYWVFKFRFLTDQILYSFIFLDNFQIVTFLSFLLNSLITIRNKYGIF